MRTTNIAVNLLTIGAVLVSASYSAFAQTGGAYDNSHNVAAGGGSRSASGSTTVEGTIGQPQAGAVSTGGTYNLRGGFWSSNVLAPTAAAVSITGKITVGGEIPFTRVRILLLQLNNGVTRQAKPNQFGIYRFDELEIGTYVIRAIAPNCVFTPSEIVIGLQDDLNDADFTIVP